MRIIFQYILPLNENATSASGIRPLQMLKAFKNLGCEIDLITAYAYGRKRFVAEVKKATKSGVKNKLVYSESSITYRMLEERYHVPSNSSLDLYHRLVVKS